MTGQQEIERLVRRLRNEFPPNIPKERTENVASSLDDANTMAVEENDHAETSTVDEDEDKSSDTPEDEQSGSDVERGNGDQDSDTNDGDEDDEGKSCMRVLPLYSMLSTAKQMRIFAEPPPGMAKSRCVAAE